MAERGDEIIPDSPFYPDHPLPAELFAGRVEQIDRIMTRGARQVAHGKPVAFYVRGEYGIGKSSLARYAEVLAATEYGLHPIYASMGGARELADVAAVVLEATVRSGKLNPRKLERVSSWLTRYIEKVQVLGVTVNTDALKQDAALLSTPLSLIAFLSDALERLKDTGVTGIFLVVDEINGITRNPQFAPFIKDLPGGGRGGPARRPAQVAQPVPPAHEATGSPRSRRARRVPLPAPHGAALPLAEPA